MNANNTQDAEGGWEQQPAQASETPLSSETPLPVEAAQQAAEGAWPIETPEPHIHETLLEGVSAEALAASGAGDPDAPPHADAAGPAASEPGSEAAPLAEDLTVVPEETVQPATETVTATVEKAADAMSDVVETVAAAAPVQPIAQPDFRGAIDLSASPRIAEVMNELGEVNATVLTYLRGEGTAALAHWQALSGARTPGDAIRIQVDEIQRAADASLTCFATLAQRATRFTAAVGRP